MASPGALGQVRVRGLRELTRTFKEMPEEIVEEMVWELEEAADPVRKRATEIILTEVRNVAQTPVYAAMRIGVSKAQGLVYVVPAWRAYKTRRSRPNLAGLYQPRMEEALERESNQVVQRVEELLDRVADHHGF